MRLGTSNADLTAPDTTDAVQILSRLVAARSPNPPGDERAMTEAIEEEARALGLPEPTCHARRVERPNLVIRIGDGSPTLILAAHMDTVPPGDLSSWSVDPYDLNEVDGHLIGLGTADMKASIAAMLLAAARWNRERSEAGSLVLIFSADEEAGSSFGMKWLAHEGLLSADAAILTEPASLGATSWQQFFVAQRGTCVAWLTARGKPGHSGALLPREQRAGAAFAKALSALYEAELFAGWTHPVDGTPVTVNIATMVEGGIVPWAHPESLRAAIEIRTIESLTQDDVVSELTRVVSEAGLADRVTIELAPPPGGWIEPGHTVSDQHLLGAARRAWQDILGPPPDPSVLSAGTDSTWLNVAGIDALPAFGPGSVAAAHRPDESVPKVDLVRAVDLFEAVIRHYFAARCDMEP